MDDPELALENAIEHLRAESPEPHFVMENLLRSVEENNMYGSTGSGESLSVMENSSIRSVNSLSMAVKSSYCSTGSNSLAKRSTGSNSVVKRSNYSSTGSRSVLMKNSICTGSRESHSGRDNGSSDKGLVMCRQFGVTCPCSSAQSQSASQYLGSSNPSFPAAFGNAEANDHLTRPTHLVVSDNCSSSDASFSQGSKEEAFFLYVCERLLAVAKDREAMTWEARNLLRQCGKSYNEIMSAEWYNLSEVESHLVFPQCNRPSTYHPRSSLEACYNPRKQLWLPCSEPMWEKGEGKSNEEPSQLSSKCHSNLFGPSDSGVGGEPWAASNMPASSASYDRLHMYVCQQNMVASRLPERERSAQAAAIALMSNSPQPQDLNPVPHLYRVNGRKDGSGETVSCQSSQSDLFVPKARLADSANQQNSNICRSRFPAPQASHTPSPLTMQQHLPARDLPRSRMVTLFLYTLNQLPVPYAKRLSGTDFTLKDFKEKVFGRTGEYRYFFKNFFPDINSELFEEFSDEEASLPVLDGKIEARVEKV